MGFHRKMINKKMTFDYLIDSDLKTLYNSESMIFMDEFSSFVRDLYLQNKSENEILELLNYNQNEVYQSGQTN
jgi:hypothetical protein